MVNDNECPEGVMASWVLLFLTHIKKSKYNKMEVHQSS